MEEKKYKVLSIGDEKNGRRLRYRHRFPVCRGEKAIYDADAWKQSDRDGDPLHNWCQYQGSDLGNADVQQAHDPRICIAKSEYRITEKHLKKKR